MVGLSHSGHRLTPGALRDHLVGVGLMIQKVPKQLEIVDVLPRNPTGKVVKHELRAAYQD